MMWAGDDLALGIVQETDAAVGGTDVGRSFAAFGSAGLGRCGDPLAGGAGGGQLENFGPAALFAGFAAIEVGGAELFGRLLLYH